MLSSSGSRERQAGGILSLSLSPLLSPLSPPLLSLLSLSPSHLSLSPPLSPLSLSLPLSFSSFLSLHAQARIHTRALRHTAAEWRGHTVKASPLPPHPSRERQPVSLSPPLSSAFLQGLPHPGSAWKRTYRSTTDLRITHTPTSSFFPLHFLLPGSVG